MRFCDRWLLEGGRVRKGAGVGRRELSIAQVGLWCGSATEGTRRCLSPTFACGRREGHCRGLRRRESSCRRRDGGLYLAHTTQAAELPEGNETDDTRTDSAVDTH